MNHSPQYGYIAPYYAQAKRVAWDYLKQYTHMMPGYKANESELTVRIYRPQFNDQVKFFLAGADNHNALRGIYLDGGILDEFADMDPMTWDQVIQPALSDRLGWAVFIGTPKGRNHLYKILVDAEQFMTEGDPDWHSAVFKASETGIINPDELRRLKRTMSEDAYQQEYECSFSAALVGAYYGKILNRMSDQITRVPWDPNAPVKTYWDLGRNDANSIWVTQSIGRERHLIDYLESKGVDLPFYAKELRKRQDQFGYDYSEHILPHDAKQIHLGMGNRNRADILRDTGIDGRVRILPRTGLQDGIEAARVVLPTCWFDEQKTKRGMECLRNYEKEWDGVNQVFKQNPKHNWASNGADAFRYFAVDTKPDVDHESLPRQTESSYDIFGG